MYQKGHLHRDVSIGNALNLPSPEKRIPFQISELIKKVRQAEQAFSTLSTINNPINIPDNSDLSHLTTALEKLNIDETETRLELLLQDLGISDICEGVIADGDMSLRWSVLFENWNKPEIKGERSVSPPGAY